MSQDPTIKVRIKGLEYIRSKKPIPLLKQLPITVLKLLSVVKHKTIQGALFGLPARVLIKTRSVIGPDRIIEFHLALSLKSGGFLRKCTKY
jgi:hypothetical protein